MLRDRIQRRLVEMGPSPDYVGLAAEVLSLRVADAALARRLVEQALVIEDRQEHWKTIGLRLRDELPDAAGVYRMIDADGRVIYVGKAKNLRSRLSSYFAPRRWQSLPPALATAVSIDWEPAGSELAALLREAELIAEHKPHINVQLEAPRSNLTRRPRAVRDVIVVLPSVDAESVEFVCARTDGEYLLQPSRRDGSDLAVHSRRIVRFFSRLRTRTVSPSRLRLGPLVFAWLSGAGRYATRIDPEDLGAAALRARLGALLADPDLFVERIDQRKYPS